MWLTLDLYEQTAALLSPRARGVEGNTVVVLVIIDPAPTQTSGAATFVCIGKHLLHCSSWRNKTERDSDGTSHEPRGYEYVSSFTFRLSTNWKLFNLAAHCKRPFRVRIVGSRAASDGTSRTLCPTAQDVHPLGRVSDATFTTQGRQVSMIRRMVALEIYRRQSCQSVRRDV